MDAFKYLSPARTDVLKNQEIRFTQIKYLNDPFEFLPHISQIMEGTDADFLYQRYLAPSLEKVGDRKLSMDDIPEEFRSLITSELTEQVFNLKIKEVLALMPSIDPKNLIPAIFAIRSDGKGINYSTAIRDSWQEKFGVLSLSGVNDSITMWSHYSRDHSGFVIKFDSEDSFFNRKRSANDPIRTLHEVSYETVRPNIKLYDATLAEEELLAFLAEKILLTKSIEWAYEKELRMVVPLNEIAAKSGNDVYLQYFDASAIKAVYLGVNIDRTRRDEITAILAEPRYRHVQLYSASLSPRHYKIHFDRVTR